MYRSSSGKTPFPATGGAVGQTYLLLKRLLLFREGDERKQQPLEGCVQRRGRHLNTGQYKHREVYEIVGQNDRSVGEGYTSTRRPD